MADTFVEMTTAAERCKGVAPDEVCREVPTTCDCSWNDPFGGDCSNNLVDSRRSQKLFFEGLSEDVSPNGDRNFTSFPRLGRTPEGTSFWSGVDELPGSESRYNATGFGTTFDRVRVAAAVSPVLIPLYNYVEGTKLDRTWGSFLTFSADGMTAGYAGCSEEHTRFAHTQYGEDSPDATICPPGKYG